MRFKKLYSLHQKGPLFGSCTLQLTQEMEVSGSHVNNLVLRKFWSVKSIHNIDYPVCFCKSNRLCIGWTITSIQVILIIHSYSHYKTAYPIGKVTSDPPLVMWYSPNLANLTWFCKENKQIVFTVRWHYNGDNIWVFPKYYKALHYLKDCQSYFFVYTHTHKLQYGYFILAKTQVAKHLFVMFLRHKKDEDFKNRPISRWII